MPALEPLLSLVTMVVLSGPGSEASPMRVDPVVLHVLRGCRSFLMLAGATGLSCEKYLRGGKERRRCQILAHL